MTSAQANTHTHTHIRIHMRWLIVFRAHLFGVAKDNQLGKPKSILRVPHFKPEPQKMVVAPFPFPVEPPQKKGTLKTTKKKGTLKKTHTHTHTHTCMRNIEYQATPLRAPKDGVFASQGGGRFSSAAASASTSSSSEAAPGSET